jgi:phosphoenolpyruvate synthase/pyruvate phosphate dikinase
MIDCMPVSSVTIRLLDPQLHEFLSRPDALPKGPRRERAAALQEANPMLGTRGVRPGLLFEGLYEMQVRATARAILAGYIDIKVVDRSPFEALDVEGAGQLVRMGAWLGRKAKQSLRLGVCGEHGGDRDSIEFFHHSGIDYVSCSPYRVPIARVAAAQAAVQSTSTSAEWVA